MPQAAFDRAVRAARRDLRSLGRDYASGKLTAREFGDKAAERLERAHTAAVVAGRDRAGDDAPEDADDRAFAELVVDGEIEYLAGFVRDLEDGRYRDGDGNEDADAIERRASLYASRMAGTGNEAFVLTSDDEAWEWVLGAGDNCSRCPDLAAGSPYKTLPTYPGANTTPCKFNCRCRVRRSDGVEGFTTPEDEE